MINYYSVKKKLKLNRNSWSSNRILIIWGSRSETTNALLNLIEQQNDVDDCVINKCYL